MAQPTNIHNGNPAGVQQTSPLIRLPQELQDTIHAFAFPRMPRTTRIVFRLNWEANEVHNRKLDKDYVVQKFPQHTVNRWLVNKSFFVGAARAYFGNQNWCFIGRRNGFIHLCHRVESRFLADAFGLFYGLEITLGEADFRDMEKMMWYEECHGPDFERSKDLRTLLALKGLRYVKLVAGHNMYANTTQKQRMWEANMHRLESYVRSVTSGQKRTDATTSQGLSGGRKQLVKKSTPTRLYLGSQVMLEENVLHPMHRDYSFTDPFAEYEEELPTFQLSLMPFGRPAKLEREVPSYTTSSKHFPTVNQAGQGTSGLDPLSEPFTTFSKPEKEMAALTSLPYRFSTSPRAKQGQTATSTGSETYILTPYYSVPIKTVAQPARSYRSGHALASPNPINSMPQPAPVGELPINVSELSLKQQNSGPKEGVVHRARTRRVVDLLQDVKLLNSMIADSDALLQRLLAQVSEMGEKGGLGEMGEMGEVGGGEIFSSGEPVSPISDQTTLLCMPTVSDFSPALPSHLPVWPGMPSSGRSKVPSAFTFPRSTTLQVPAMPGDPPPVPPYVPKPSILPPRTTSFVPSSANLSLTKEGGWIERRR
ncbi:hypothetical protein LTR86_005111 [Recurvomyces mirabilis]|nr:hypothetical protein LTR86_005111 [Recurvomyces mirabilis]